MSGTLLWGLGVVSALAWVRLLFERLRAVLTAPLLSKLSAPTPPSWPSVTLVIAACNEERTVGPALESLLTQDYPCLAAVAVNDRSTDNTGAALDALAARYRHLTVLHKDTLEDGWLGKVAALQFGLSCARGDFVLFCDADVHLEAGALKRLMALVEAHQLEHLTLLPRFVTTGPLQGALMASFLEGYCQRLKGCRSVALPENLPAFGYGAFNLVRRSTLEKTEGLSWFKFDVLDDIALGELLRRSGARRGFLVADEGVSLAWYSSLLDALGHMEKNFFGGVAHYSFPRALAFVSALPLLYLSPFLALGTGPLPGWPLLVLALALYLAGSFAARRVGISLEHSLLGPMVQLAGIVPMGRGALRALLTGGVVWRGTTYPLKALRKGRRVGFP